MSGRLQTGEVVDGRYRIEAYLGGGGMASVYRAMHVVLEQPVALKIVSPHIRDVPGVAARFIREARAATSLKGTHVAHVYDVGAMPDGAPYMVMELLEGRDLGELIERGQLPAVVDAVDWVMQACQALAEVHRRGIVHRDLKPANLFLTRGEGGLPCVKLIDFGISRIDSPLSPRDAHGLTQPDAVMGSPRYMSPEMMESATKADARSDIWGLGIVLYELLVGQTPYDGASCLDLYIAAMKGPPPAPSRRRRGVPRGLDDVVLKCLRSDPADRYRGVNELAAALAPFGRTRGAGRAPSAAADRALVLCAAVVIVVGGAIAARAVLTKAARDVAHPIVSEPEAAAPPTPSEAIARDEAPPAPPTTAPPPSATTPPVPTHRRVRARAPEPLPRPTAAPSPLPSAPPPAEPTPDDGTLFEDRQ